MILVNMHDAKTHLSQLLEKMNMGEEIVIAKAGRPVARLLPYENKTTREPGLWQGQVKIEKDFDKLPDELLAAFYGEGDEH